MTQRGSGLLIMAALAGAAPLLSQSPRSSPTGREPRLAWTAARQAAWDRMRAENHPLFRAARDHCTEASRGRPRYGDRGLWCTWYYQVTGNPSVGRTAWLQARHSITSPPSSANDVRENFIENAIILDWVWPVLSPAERDSGVAGLNVWAEFALGINTKRYQGGFSYADSDALVGYYLGLAATDVVARGSPGTAIGSRPAPPTGPASL